MKRKEDSGNELAQWYVLQTKSRAEKLVQKRLENQGFETFLPLVTTLKQWSDRKKKVTEVLIPSIVFIHTSQRELTKCYSDPGVYSILKLEGRFAVVKEVEINNLRILTTNDAPGIEVATEFKTGDWVRVVRGPFAGIIAQTTDASHPHRLVLEFSDLNCAYYIDVSKAHTELL